MIPHDLQAYWQLFINSLPDELYFLIGAVLSVEILILFYVLLRGKDKKWISISMITGYVIIVFFYTVIFRPTETHRAFNLMPFWSYTANRPEMTPLYLEKVLNIVLFIPLGLWGGVVFRKDKLIRNIVFCICFSISIEIFQFIFRKGFSETDDVLHNVLGGIIGYLLYCFINKMKFISG